MTFHRGVDRPCQGGVDSPNYAIETDLFYDGLRFEANIGQGMKKTVQEGVDSPNYASEADLPYDSLSFDASSGPGMKTKLQGNTDFESEYSYLKI